MGKDKLFFKSSFILNKSIAQQTAGMSWLCSYLPRRMPKFLEGMEMTALEVRDTCLRRTQNTCAIAVGCDAKDPQA